MKDRYRGREHDAIRKSAGGIPISSREIPIWRKNLSMEKIPIAMGKKNLPMGTKISAGETNSTPAPGVELGADSRIRPSVETTARFSMNQTHDLPDEVATRTLARTIGAQLQAGDFVWLSGPLGAGKTTFAQELARAVGVTEPVSSPTFVIVSEYGGRIPLLHCDAYRLEGLEAEELADAGLEELVARTDAVRLLEWPEMVAPFVGPPTWKIEISFSDGGKTRQARIYHPL